MTPCLIAQLRKKSSISALSFGLSLRIAQPVSAFSRSTRSLRTVSFGRTCTHMRAFHVEKVLVLERIRHEHDVDRRLVAFLQFLVELLEALVVARCLAHVHTL